MATINRLQQQKLKVTVGDKAQQSRGGDTNKQQTQAVAIRAVTIMVQRVMLVQWQQINHLIGKFNWLQTATATACHCMKRYQQQQGIRSGTNKKDNHLDNNSFSIDKLFCEQT